jgi:putative MATE family efflux protein
MVVSSTGVFLNTVLGYILIFGKLGMPALGAQGAAYANLIARIMECLLMVWLVYYLKTPLAVHPRQMIAFDRPFLSRILSRVLPVMFNELMWSLGISAYNAVYAHISTESIAAINIKTSIEDLVFVPVLGVTHACAILVGNAIGSGEQEKSHDFVKQSAKVVFIIALTIGVGLVLSRGYIASLYNVSDTTAFYTRNLLFVLGSVLWMRSVNTFLFIGMMRAGGDTRFSYLMDVGSIWLVGVPIALLTAFVFHWPVHYVYLAVMIDELVKFFLSIWRFKSRRWIHNLV